MIRSPLGSIRALGGILVLLLGGVWGSTVEAQANADPNAEPNAQPGAQPNLVLIMADDLGWSDTSNAITNQGHPSDFYETPAIDRLAAQGMSFTNAYVNQNCAPTRAAMLTGQYAPRPTNNVYQVGNLNRGGGDTMLVGPAQGLPNGDDAIPNAAITFVEVLQDAGYATAHFGKFHVTPGEGEDITAPGGHGFDRNYGGTRSGAPGNYHAEDVRFGDRIGPALDPFAARYTQAYVNQNIKPFANGTSMAAIDALVGTEKHVTDAMADAAIDFMSTHADRPFLVQFHPYAVHTPIGNRQARGDLLDKYQNKPPGTEDHHASFGAITEGLDQAVARLIETLENTPDPRHPGQMLAANTLVIFLSDNGGRESQSNNGPLAGQKGELLEGGIRVPFVAWSGNAELVQGGTINPTPIAGIDFYPTLSSLAGAVLPDGWTLDGVDLSAVFADAAHDLGRDRLYWHLPGYLVDARNQRPQTVVRHGDLKLTYSYETQSFGLFDVVHDLAESHDLAAEQPETVTRLGLEMMDWLFEVQAPLAMLREGKMVLLFGAGSSYANRTRIEHPNGTVMVIDAGDEVPMIVGERRSSIDLNLDGVVDRQDWLACQAEIGPGFAALGEADRYVRGDLDLDGQRDDADLAAFREAFEALSGAGSFAAMLAE